MPACRNPECRSGRTPGVVGTGRGTPGKALVGAVMRWGWVNCRACSPTDFDKQHNLEYKHVDRTPDQMKERARLADTRAEYKAEQVTTPLQRIRLKSEQNSLTQAVTPPDNTRLDKLLDQVTKLSEQVSELLAENRALRAQADVANAPKSRVKKSVATRAKPS